MSHLPYPVVPYQQYFNAYPEIHYQQPPCASNGYGWHGNGYGWQVDPKKWHPAPVDLSEGAPPAEEPVIEAQKVTKQNAWFKFRFQDPADKTDNDANTPERAIISE